MAQFIVLVDAALNIRAVYAGGVNASFIFHDLDVLRATGELQPMMSEKGKIRQNGVLLTHGPTDHNVTNNMEAWPQDWTADSVKFFTNSHIPEMNPRHEQRIMEIPVDNMRVPLNDFGRIMQTFAGEDLTPAVLEFGNRDRKVPIENTHALYSITEEGGKGDLLKNYNGNMIVFNNLMEHIKEGDEVVANYPGAGALLDFALNFCVAGKETSSYSSDYLQGYRCWEDDNAREELFSMLDYMKEYTQALKNRRKLRRARPFSGVRKTRRERQGFTLGKDSGNDKVLKKLDSLVK